MRRLAVRKCITSKSHQLFLSERSRMKIMKMNWPRAKETGIFNALTQKNAWYDWRDSFQVSRTSYQRLGFKRREK